MELKFLGSHLYPGAKTANFSQQNAKRPGITADFEKTWLSSGALSFAGIDTLLQGNRPSPL